MIEIHSPKSIPNESKKKKIKPNLDFVGVLKKSNDEKSVNIFLIKKKYGLKCFINFANNSAAVIKKQKM